MTSKQSVLEELRGRRVTVVGLAREGTALTRFLCQAGAHVRIRKIEAVERDSIIRYGHCQPGIIHHSAIDPHLTHDVRVGILEYVHQGFFCGQLYLPDPVGDKTGRLGRLPDECDKIGQLA